MVARLLQVAANLGDTVERFDHAVARLGLARGDGPLEGEAEVVDFALAEVEPVLLLWDLPDGARPFRRTGGNNSGADHARRSASPEASSLSRAYCQTDSIIV